MSEDMDEPASKKAKVAPQNDIEEDPLSELEKLEPLPQSHSATVTMNMDSIGQQSSSVHMAISAGAGPSSVGSSGPGSQPPPVSHAGYLGPGASIQSQSSQQQHNTSAQQSATSQTSVLQELLLNPNPNQTLNSPRPPFATQFQTRSPMTSGASILTANCPPNAALSVGARSIRGSAPQLYTSGNHELTMQTASGPQMGQQGSYVAAQMIPAHNQQPTQSLAYAYQQASGSRPVFANTSGSRAVYAGTVRCSTTQSMGLGRTGMLNGSTSGPRMRAPPQGMMLQQNNGQMMRAMMVQQGAPYEQSGYAMPSGTATIQRSSDPYQMQPSQSQMIPPSHMIDGHSAMPSQAAQQQPPPPVVSIGHTVMQQQIGAPVVVSTTQVGVAKAAVMSQLNMSVAQINAGSQSAANQLQQFPGLGSSNLQRDSAVMGGSSVGNNACAHAANAATQDPEKRKLIQQQLVLLLHAHKCQQRERSTDANGRSACTLPHCSTMKDVLQHMTACNSGRSCKYTHCASSRQIISHWKNCVREDCPVCKPLKSIHNTGNQQAERRPLAGNDSLANITGPGSQPIQCPPVGTATLDSNVATARLSSAGGLVATSLPPTNAATTANPGNYGSPGPSSANSLLIDYNPSGDPFRSPNPPNKFVPSFGKGSGMFMPPKDTIGLPPPDAPQVVKSWQEEVTKDLRNHLVGKLVKAIFPAPDPAAMHDQRIKDLITYARKVEREMFEVANDREEYYHLLAEKIYKIQKELQEKKMKRLHEQGRSGVLSSVQQQQLGAEMADMPGPPNRTTPTFQASVNTHASSQPNGPSVATNAAVMTNGQMVSTSGIKLEPSDALTNGVKATARSSADVGCSVKPGSSTASIAEKSVKVTPVTSNTVDTKVVKSEPKADMKTDEGRDLPEKIFDANEIRNFLKPIVDKITGMEESIPFRIPVDPEILGIPDYFDIVKNPMDLSTISDKLDKGIYKNPSEFCDDMWLMFENAWTYNRKNSKVYKYCNKLSEEFQKEINPVMQKMGYCCGMKLSFTPLALFCYGQSMCTIARDQKYQVYETTSTQYGVTVSDRYTYCLRCFDALPETGISLTENPDDTSNMVPKSKFQLMKNDQIDYEPYEKCVKCYRRWHTLCAVYNKKVYPEGFICDTCRKEQNLPKTENRFTARRLPQCSLSRFIEERVNKFMKNDSVGKDYEVIIRVLCVTDKEVEVKPYMKQKYGVQGFPEKFPYRSKAIFAFEVIDSYEVCFFGLHVQEFGSSCAPPNRRRVYIAYLDSVHFFQPRQLRTEVYHEILLGYLHYVQVLGYTMAHIWACPPSEGDDYIFHCHPPEQKIPKPKRLQDWYKKLLDKGVGENTVFDYKDIYKQARDDGLTTPMGLPYFEGDFWPNVIEDCIRDVQMEEVERKKQEEAAAAHAQNGEDEDDDMIHSGDNEKAKKNSKKKNSLKNQKNKNKKKVCAQTGNEVMDRLYTNFEKHKEVFFTIRLMSPQSELSAQNNDIRDPDPLMPSELMDGRDTFLTRARDEHWEFSSLRRAKYSTMCMCHALHNQEKSEGLSYTCNSCQGSAVWHCQTCEDFDLCNKCYETMSHAHKLEKVNTLVDVSSDDKQDSVNSRNESIQRCIQSLVHACQCRDANCRRVSCHKMKRVVQHTKVCKKRQNADCPICKQLIALCCYHAKHCTGTSCAVPFCLNIRQKLQEQRRSQNRRADMMMRRRMDMLSSGYGGTNTPGSSQPSTSNSMGILQPSTSHHGPGQMSAYHGGNLAQMQQIQVGQGATSNHQQVQMQQMQTHQFQQHGKGGGVQGSSQMHLLGVPTSVQQAHPVGQLQQNTHQQNVRNVSLSTPMGGMQRQGMVTQLQHQQPSVNPPSYARSGSQQAAYTSSNPAPSSNYSSTGGQVIMMGQQAQQQQIMQQGMQGVRQRGTPLSQNDPQIQAILARLQKADRPEEREQIFKDLKQMPHVFSAFIKKGQQGDIAQGLNQQQINAVQQQQGMLRQQQLAAAASQQSGQWAQQGGTPTQTQQYYQQQQAGTAQQTVAQQQQARGPGGQYASSNIGAQGQIAPSGVAITQPSQWQQQFQRNPQPVSPATAAAAAAAAMQNQFSQVRSPPIGRSPSVSGLAPSPMMQPGGAQQVQQMQQGSVNQEQQPYR